jgi:hypothetical protein
MGSRSQRSNEEAFGKRATVDAGRAKPTAAVRQLIESIGAAWAAAPMLRMLGFVPAL